MASSKGGGKESDSEYVFKVELVWFTDGLDVKCGRTKNQGGSQVFGPHYW